MINKNLKQVGFILLIILLVLYGLYKGERADNKVEEISYSDFLNMIEPADGIKPIGKIITASEGKNKKLDLQDFFMGSIYIY